MGKIKMNFSFLTRKKVFNDVTVNETNLARVLGLLDALSIGIGSTLGSGIYIFTGGVIRTQAGPATVISYIIAGIATFFSALSYAELGSRVPRSGSEYIYIYVSIGEFFAFMMGWILALGYIISAASTSKAISAYVNSLVGYRVENALASLMPMHSPGLTSYVDVLAFSIAIFMTVLMIIGVRESTFLNKVFTIFNLFALVFMIIAGATRTNTAYWHIDVQNVSWLERNETLTCESEQCGSGGFLPFGVSGLIAGAANCFYAFIGFDAICSTGEELKNPRRNIPLSILLTLLIIGSLYCGLTVVLTLMTPYYLMDTQTPLPFAFEYAHLDWCKYIAFSGALVSLFACLYSGMFPMPRIVYAMSCDGLLFKPFSAILPKLKTPWIASLFTGIIGAILSAILDLNELVDMLSIGTLVTYTLMSVCVLVLRYRPKEYDSVTLGESTERFRSNESFIKLILITLFSPREKEPSLFTSRVSNLLILLCIILIAVITVLVSIVKITHVYLIVIVSVLGFNLLVAAFSLYLQPVNIPKTSFMTPLLPVIPLASVFMNVYMMTTLSLATSYRLAIWLCIGMIVYFGYGKNNSIENPNREIEYSCCCVPCLGRVKKESKSPDNVTIKQSTSQEFSSDDLEFTKF